MADSNILFGDLFTVGDVNQNYDRGQRPILRLLALPCMLELNWKELRPQCNASKHNPRTRA